jgi:hypothetical protein
MFIRVLSRECINNILVNESRIAVRQRVTANLGERFRILMHMQLAKRKGSSPAFVLPGDRGTVPASDVVAAPAGPGRDGAIEQTTRWWRIGFENAESSEMPPCQRG